MSAAVGTGSAEGEVLGDRDEIIGLRVGLWVGVEEAGEEGGRVGVNPDLDGEEGDSRSEGEGVVGEGVGCGY